MAISMKAKKECPFCGLVGIIDLTTEQAEQYQWWDTTNKRQDYIQDGLNTWTPEMREMLLTGVDQKCWSENMLDPKEED